MTMPNVRLLPFETADGATNMSADEAMLLSAAEGVASFRMYAWSPATLSLGYFQPAAARLSSERLSRLPWVRRASGGATLVHDQELTYALALPAGAPWQSPRSWMPRFHEIFRRVLSRFSIETRLAEVESLRGDVLCFEMQTVGDLLCQGHKVAGSAQRKHRRALLQHGSLLLRQSESTPSLPGLRELTGADLDVDRLFAEIVAEMTAETGWPLTPDDWTDVERQTTRRLIDEKFGSAAWNKKR